jgi:hypothetical protein
MPDIHQSNRPREMEHNRAPTPPPPTSGFAPSRLCGRSLRNISQLLQVHVTYYIWDAEAVSVVALPCPPLPYLDTRKRYQKTDCYINELQTLTADLHELGYTNQTSIDFSRVVIDAMKAKHADMETQWCVMDVRNLELPDASIDVAIDKGTLDAMIHGSLWDPPEDVRSNVGKYVDEVGEHRFSFFSRLQNANSR